MYKNREDLKKEYDKLQAKEARETPQNIQEAQEQLGEVFEKPEQDSMLDVPPEMRMDAVDYMGPSGEAKAAITLGILLAKGVARVSSWFTEKKEPKE